MHPETGGEILLVPNASPLRARQARDPPDVAVARVVESGLPLIYLNQVGGQDELVFDGGSFALNADRTLGVQLPAFRAMVARTVWERARRAGFASKARARSSRRATRPITRPACMGLRDYVENNRFPGVVLGLSGGVDSALCAAMAVDALGAERVHAVMLPYRFTSNESLADAAAAPRRSASATTSSRSPSRSRASRPRWRRCSPASRATSPRRTSRAARAASS